MNQRTGDLGDARSNCKSGGESLRPLNEKFWEEKKDISWTEGKKSYFVSTVYYSPVLANLGAPLGEK